MVGVQAMVGVHAITCPALQLCPCYFYDLKALAGVEDGVKGFTEGAGDPNNF